MALRQGWRWRPPSKAELRPLPSGAGGGCRRRPGGTPPAGRRGCYNCILEERCNISNQPVGRSAIRLGWRAAGACTPHLGLAGGPPPASNVFIMQANGCWRGGALPFPPSRGKAENNAPHISINRPPRASRSVCCIPGPAWVDRHAPCHSQLEIWPPCALQVRKDPLAPPAASIRPL